MTFATITPTVSDYGAYATWLTDYLDVYNDDRSRSALTTAEDITGIFIDEAKAEVLRDLQLALSLNPDNANHQALIDAIIAEQPSRIRFAIALVQMSLTFGASSQGEESENARIRREMRSRYEAERKGFPGLVSTKGNTTVTTIPLYL